MTSDAQSPSIQGAPTLDDIRCAAERISPYVRHTPMIACAPVRSHREIGASLTLKLECLQVVGSFKPRGAINKLFSLPDRSAVRGLITASGGNHGLGVAYAATVANVPSTIYVPTTTPPAKIEKLKRWNAEVIVAGDSWDESNRFALEAAERNRLTYVHAFADPMVIAGQGTVGLEIMEDSPAVDTLVVAIGGGGLIAGIAIAAKAINPALRIIGVEPTGAATLHDSIKTGRIVTLDLIKTAALTLGARATEQINLDLIRHHVAELVLVSDDEIREAARWLWFELGVAAELGGAAAVAAVIAGKYRAAQGERVCALVCGAGTDGIQL
ncbi:MAG TPA: pyridoxal-phosphate dependent enzyme [Candidatus Binataceae bacterium]|nr:pyridoxal-phosphate dependent enzyme [Candidatus Binataceae bacterium]